jgi:hypothetical protein
MISLSTSGTSTSDPRKPWLRDFHGYLNSTDHLPPGMSVVQWWGINAARYPVWASLARDYLVIAATSVSSERTFSAAGITISKRRSRLKANIVEALQCMKSLIRQDIIFQENPSVASEVGMSEVSDSHSTSSSRTQEGTSDGWDAMVEGLDDKEHLCEVDEDEDVSMIQLDY